MHVPGRPGHCIHVSHVSFINIQLIRCCRPCGSVVGANFALPQTGTCCGPARRRPPARVPLCSRATHRPIADEMLSLVTFRMKGLKKPAHCRLPHGNTHNTPCRLMSLSPSSCFANASALLSTHYSTGSRHWPQPGRGFPLWR